MLISTAGCTLYHHCRLYGRLNNVTLGFQLGRQEMLINDFTSTESERTT
jgi:hypothetical protein